MHWQKGESRHELHDLFSPQHARSAHIVRHGMRGAYAQLYLTAFSLSRTAGLAVFFYVISHWLRAANKVFPSNGKDGFQLTCIQTYKLTEQDCCYRHQLTCLGGWEREHTIDWERWWKYVVEFSSISCYWSCKQGLETYIGSCWHSADKSTFSCRVIDAEYI